MPLVLDNVKLSRKTLELCVTLNIPKGKCVAIMGPKESGKTSLLHLIAGFEQPSAGTIFFGGHSLSHLLPAHRPLTILFQEHNLFDHLTIWDNIALGFRGTLHLSYQERQFMKRVLGWVGLEGWERKKPQELPHAQQQRAAIAQGVLQRRPLWLLDDPFSVLKPDERGQILALIQEIHQELNLTTLLVTHHPEDAAFISQKILFMNKGKIIMSGPTKEMLMSAHPDLHAFMKEAKNTSSHTISRK